MKKLFLCLSVLVSLCTLSIQVQATSFLQEIAPIDQSALSLHSEYAYVWNVEEQMPLYEKASHERMYPASLTKVMTTLVALDELSDLDEVILMSADLFVGLAEEGASVAGYQIGEEATVRDLLYGILLPSGADAARAIAKRVAGSEAAYAEKMNEKAQALGMKDTHFVNTSGLHEDAHYTTAYDLSLLLEAALKNETFQELFGAVSYHSELGNHTFYSTRLSGLSNAGIQNDFLTGSKTGFTLEGGLCLAASMEVNGAHYLIITGNAGNEFASGEHIRDAYRIYQYLQDHYQLMQIHQKLDSIRQVEVSYGKEEQVDGMVLVDASILVEKGKEAEVTIAFTPTDSTTAPISTYDVIGTETVSSPSLGIVHTYEVYAMHGVERDVWSYLFHSWWFYALLCLFVLSLLSLLHHHKLKQRRIVYSKH